MNNIPEFPEEKVLTILRYFMKTSVPRIIADQKKKTATK